MKSPTFKRGAVVSCLIFFFLVSLLSASAAVAGDPDPKRYIVSFLDVGKGKSALRAAGARVVLDLPNHEIAAVHIPSQALKGLRKNPNIEYIEKDVLRYPMAQSTPWGIPEVQADLVRYDSVEGARTICIIDSGYSSGHEDLPENEYVNGTDDPDTGNWGEDTCYHGTHVAGTISALDNGNGVVGVIPGAVGLHIVKVFDGPDCSWTYSSNLVAALDKCTSANANIVSMSLGGSFKSRSEQRAFGEAYNTGGVLSIAAAGNDGNNRKSYPASYDSVVSVAAIDSARVIADFSQQNDQVELAAPGVAVRSTVGMDQGLEESLRVDGQAFEAAALDGSAKSQTAKSGNLIDCGLGTSTCKSQGGAICLIERGDITFAEKAQNCKDGGGDAAIIYNNGGGLFGGTLGENPPSIHTVAVSSSDGTLLQGLLGKTAEVTVDSGHYAYYDGTSMATPHVSGVAALVWSQDTNCTNGEIRNALALTAEDLGPAGRDVAYGYGLVQAGSAASAITDSNDSLYPLCGGGGSEPPPSSCGVKSAGALCTDDNECSSCNCKGRPGAKTCK